MIAELIYEQLKERDKRLSKSRFCMEYLGMDRNYLFVCRYQGDKDISSRALLNLYGSLKGASNVWQELGQDYTAQQSDQFQSQRAFTQELATQVMEEIERRALT